MDLSNNAHPELFTPQETASELKIAESTLRKYAQRFSNQLNPGARRQPRRYTASDINVLRQIIRLRSEGYLLETISGHLIQEALPTISDATVVPSLGQNPSLGQYPALAERSEQPVLKDSQVTSAFEQIEDRLTTIEQKLENLPENDVDVGRLARLNDLLGTLQTEFMQIRAEVHRLRESQKNLDRRIATIEESLKSSFWSRLTSKPGR